MPASSAQRRYNPIPPSAKARRPDRNTINRDAPQSQEAERISIEAKLCTLHQAGHRLFVCKPNCPGCREYAALTADLNARFSSREPNSKSG